MKGLLLFLTALILKLLFYPIGFCYSILLTFFKNGYIELDKYFFNCALADDQQANTYLAKLFNDILIIKGGHKFGNVDETISSVLGKNLKLNTLSIIGKGLNSILNLFENDHTIKSIEN
jgi:8-oxo-dGTP diphosphatase